MWHYHSNPDGAVTAKGCANGNPRTCETEGPGPTAAARSRPARIQGGITAG